MENVVYLKTVDNYDEVIKERNFKIPNIFKKVIYMYKNCFNIITKKKIDKYNIWILPIKEKYSKNKIKNILKEVSKYPQNKFVLSNDILNKENAKLINEYKIKFFDGENVKKKLLLKVLEYITKIQNKDLNDIEVTFLVNDNSTINLEILIHISKLIKKVKIVSKNLYKFNKIEENLYNEFGIALQLSNSYRKSLLKSTIIINLDFNELEINEYIINNNSIIINCFKDNIKIKSKLFNGIIINSFNVKFKNKTQEIFKTLNIYNKFNNLMIYESIIYKENKLGDIIELIEEDNLSVINLIGNNGSINKKEIKNIYKKLDKKLKTE